jgi:Holliday junction resolvasome RuvABC endonuclease subunit
LGTNTGYAHNLAGESILTAGTWKLATPKEITQWGKERWTRRNDPRIHRLQQYLVSLPKPDVVVFEDVEFSTYTLQTQLWSSFRTCVWLTLGKSCLLECVPVATLKKFATGHGGAKKEQMAEALFKQDPGFRDQQLDDNAIDAIWLFRWAQMHLSRVKFQ